MSKLNVKKMFRDARTVVSRHSPEILTGIGIAGMITTTVLAVRATPKALKQIEEEKHRQNYEICKEARDNGYDTCEQITNLRPIEVVKLTWKGYLPAAITGIASIACLIGASKVHLGRNAALATAYKLSETALTEYRDKVVETIGEKKEQVIREKVDKEQIEKKPVSTNEVIVTQKGSTLCFDYYSSRYFESDIELFKKAINQLNAMMLREEYVSLNDLYDELNIPHTGIGDDMGWNANRVGRDLIQPRISSHIADDGRPCIVMSCEPAPKHGYMDYM